ncbi:MAG: TraR/DksA C4-type zinc finger protein [Myxococcales bacterium]|nr:TraR/DksA C4-type zinc finger protein [Myxococcales bacterium]MCB9754777.1 TraR/DksA C4-type zinc finger protein [Myxococcales bacterium]
MARRAGGPGPAEDDELSESERQRFRALLERLRDELVETGDVTLEPNRVDAADVGGDEDAQPLNEMSQAIASSRNRARTGSLHLIEAALRKLRESPEDYGLCEVCDELIRRRRLELLPYARLCVRCKSKREDPRGGARKKLTDFV